MFSNKERDVIAKLIENRIIPYSCNFDITENILCEFTTTYDLLYSKSSGMKSKTNKRYARKLAGRTLLKYKQSLGATVTSCKEGIVYLIENEAFPDHYKVGMTNDLTSRLKSYQTYDPMQRFAVKHYEFVLDKREVEKRILNSFRVQIEKGEWIKRIDSKTFLALVK